MSTQTTAPVVGACRRCERSLIAASVWLRTPIDQREVWKAAGLARARRRDLCVACGVWLISHGHLVRTPRTDVQPDQPRTLAWQPVPWVRCRRCGQGRVTGCNLCQDCTEVVADLDEIQAWAG